MFSNLGVHGICDLIVQHYPSRPLPLAVKGFVAGSQFKGKGLWGQNSPVCCSYTGTRSLLLFVYVNHWRYSGSRTFQYAALTLWNQLPITVCLFESLEVFRKQSIPVCCSYTLEPAPYLVLQVKYKLGLNRANKIFLLQAPTFQQLFRTGVVLIRKCATRASVETNENFIMTSQWSPLWHHSLHVYHNILMLWLVITLVMFVNNAIILCC